MDIIGVVYRTRKDFDSAALAFQKALDLAGKCGAQVEMGDRSALLTDFARFEFERGNLDEAQAAVDKAHERIKYSLNSHTSKCRSQFMNKLPNVGPDSTRNLPIVPHVFL